VRRWFEEVIITFYQMTVLVEARGFGSASTLVFEDGRRCFSCGVRELKRVWRKADYVDVVSRRLRVFFEVVGMEEWSVGRTLKIAEGL